MLTLRLISCLFIINQTGCKALFHVQAVPVQDLSGPRVARTVRNYSEHLGSERDGKRRRGDVKDKALKRGSKSGIAYVPPSEIDGAAARAAEWRGGVLTKKEANSFIKAVRLQRYFLRASCATS